MTRKTGEEEYIPSQQEVDEMLNLYNDFLEEELTHNGKQAAISRATARVKTCSSGHVFKWVVANDYALILELDSNLND